MALHSRRCLLQLLHLQAAVLANISRMVLVGLGNALQQRGALSLIHILQIARAATRRRRRIAAQ